MFLWLFLLFINVIFHLQTGFLWMMRVQWHLLLNTSVRNTILSLDMDFCQQLMLALMQSPLICLWRFFFPMFIMIFDTIRFYYYNILFSDNGISLTPDLQNCWRPKIFKKIKWEAGDCTAKGNLSTSWWKGKDYRAGKLLYYNWMSLGWKERNFFLF